MANELEHARDAERAFLLSVSHELKTPLTAVIGYAEGLADGTVDADVAAATIGKEAARLERLVRDILDLARMNRHEFSVRSEPVDVGEVAAECSRRHEAQASAYGIELVLDTEDEAGARGDADRLLQALSNLVENALRISPAGGTVRIVARPGLLAVEDEGPGLRPEEIPRAFERFFLYSRYAGSRPVGTGLGLAIVDELARAMASSRRAVGSSASRGFGRAAIVRGSATRWRSPVDRRDTRSSTSSPRPTASSAAAAAARSARRSSSTSSTFSRALRNGINCASCATNAISLRRSRSSGARPSTATSPASGGARPASACRRVVLPEPEGPVTAVRQPPRNDAVTPSSTRRVP